MTIDDKKNCTLGYIAMLDGVNEMLNAELGKGEPGFSGDDRWIVVFRFPFNATRTVALDPEFMVT